MSILFYRRPAYSRTEPGYINSTACQRYVERTANAPPRIPGGLTFSNILENKTLPPCTLGDFMDYLMYIAHDAESLQFLLWYRDYTLRFSSLPDDKKAQSKEWRNNTNQILEAVGSEWPLPPGIPPGVLSGVLPGSGCTTADGTPADDGDRVRLSTTSIKDGIGPSTYITALPDAKSIFSVNVDVEKEDEHRSFVEKSAQMHKKRSRSSSSRKSSVDIDVLSESENCAFLTQPFRSEITRVITHYLSPSAPRRLNLPPSILSQVLHALQFTTHPSAFTPAIDLVTIYLREHCHPNFIRWSICNGNQPRVYFVRTMGVLHTIFGFLIAVLLTLSSVSRWWRVMAAPMWFIGFSTLIAAIKGICVILHTGGQKRNLKPWESPQEFCGVFTGSVSESNSGGEGVGTDIELGAGFGSAEAGAGAGTETEIKTPQSPNSSTNSTFVSSVSSSGNTTTATTAALIEDMYSISEARSEVLAKYERKSLVKKVFDKTVRVQESALRILQDRIMRQAQIWAGLLTVVLSVGFVALPAGGYY